MLANLQGGMAGGLTQRAGIGGGGGSGIPFSIQGTTSNPSFAADVGSVAGNVAKGAVQNAVSGKTGATRGLGGLLGRKK